MTATARVMERALSADEAAALLQSWGLKGKGPKRVYAMAAAGELPSHKDGRLRFFLQSELEEWFRQRLEATREG